MYQYIFFSTSAYFYISIWVWRNICYVVCTLIFRGIFLLFVCKIMESERTEFYEIFWIRNSCLQRNYLFYAMLASKRAYKPKMTYMVHTFFHFFVYLLLFGLMTDFSLKIFIYSLLTHFWNFPILWPMI